MKIIEVEARARLLGFIAASGRRLKYKEKKPERLARIAAEIFILPAEKDFMWMTEAVSRLGQAERRKRCEAYRVAQVIPHPWASRHLRLVSTKAAPPRVDMADEIKIRNFYESWEWKHLSYEIKLDRGRICECCGAHPPQVRIITDHIRPLRHYWHLRLDRTNLQILCDDCNKGKASRDSTDFRPFRRASSSESG